MSTCEDCGCEMIGDGYHSVIHCENADDRLYEFHEPDANPVMCGVKHLGFCKIGTVLLKEEDCIPSADQQHFGHEMNERYGICMMDFNPFNNIKTNSGKCLQSHYKGYVLEYCIDHPFYRLKSGVTE